MRKARASNETRTLKDGRMIHGQETEVGGWPICRAKTGLLPTRVRDSQARHSVHERGRRGRDCLSSCFVELRVS